MLVVEQTGSSRAVSSFCTKEWNPVSKMDLDKLNFSPSSESSTEMSGKSRIEYILQKSQRSLPNCMQILVEKIATCGPSLRWPQTGVLVLQACVLHNKLLHFRSGILNLRPAIHFSYFAFCGYFTNVFVKHTTKYETLTIHFSYFMQI